MNGIQFSARDKDCNQLAKSLLLVRLADFIEIPDGKMTFIANHVVASLTGLDCTLHGLWYDIRVPQEFIYPITIWSEYGLDQYCWSYHLYDKEFIIEKHSQIYKDHSQLPTYVPVIIPE